MIRRITPAMDENLTLVERAEIGRLRIPQLDHAQEIVIDRVRHRDRIRELLRRRDAVVMADRDVRRG